MAPAVVVVEDEDDPVDRVITTTVRAPTNTNPTVAQAPTAVHGSRFVRCQSPSGGGGAAIR
jgi:hypothetical protein